MANKAIFLDRDNTLVEDPGYISDPEQLKILPGVPAALKQLSQMDFKLVVVSNQSGVARGIITEKKLKEINEHLIELFDREGVKLDAIYYCPYLPDASVPKYRRESNLRKPSPGMLLLAAKEMNIDLLSSWMLGNSHRDVIAGSRAGCKTILLDTPATGKDTVSYSKGEPDSSKPDYKAVNMKEAVNIIKRHEGLLKNPSPVPDSIPQTQEPSEQAEEVKAEPPAQEGKEPVGASMSDSTGETAESPAPSSGPAAPGSEHIETHLRDIHALLKSIHRHHMFSEFSGTKLLAGTLQVIVVFCLVLTLLLLKDTSPALITLGFALVLQMMALTFYIMHDRK